MLSRFGNVNFEKEKQNMKRSEGRQRKDPHGVFALSDSSPLDDFTSVNASS